MNSRRPIAFIGGVLVDGTGSAPLAASAVCVEDGIIRWTGPAGSLERASDHEVIDVSGKYIIPGLVDANIHLLLHYEPEILLQFPPGRYDDLVLEAAQVALRAGITTVFDTWGPLDALRRVRDGISAGELVGSRIFFAGNIIGLGGPWSDDFLPMSDFLSSQVVETVNECWEQGVGSDLLWLSADELRPIVRQYIRTSGIDFVKYAGSGHKAMKLIALSPDSQRVIVEEAHAAGMTAQACTMTPEALKLAIAADVDLLQHGDITGVHPMPSSILDEIVSRQLPCVAFLMTERHMDAKRQDASPLSKIWLAKDINDRNLIHAGATLLLATDGGLFGPTARMSPRLARYVTAPDAPILLGSSHLLWLQAATELGMPPMEILLSATRNIADAYGKGAEIGTVEPGKCADLVVLDGNPLDDVANYSRVTHVVKDGVVIDRDRLPERNILADLGASRARSQGPEA